MSYGYRMAFGGFGIMFTIVFLLILGVFLVTIVGGIKQWNKNNHSPRLTVPATVIAKRTNVSHHHRGTDHHHHSSTSYYVTFQVDSGDRMELPMTGPEFGLLIEGNRGNLTFQGTRYLGFTRV